MDYDLNTFSEVVAKFGGRKRLYHTDRFLYADWIASGVNLSTWYLWYRKLGILTNLVRWARLNEVSLSQAVTILNKENR